MASGLLSSFTNNVGEHLTDGTAQSELGTRYANHSIYIKFEDENTEEDYTCAKQIVGQFITLSEKDSVFQGLRENKDIVKVSSFDNYLGVNFSSNTKGRGFLLVCNEPDVADEDLPDEDDVYAKDKNVLFSGYTKTDFAIDLNLVQQTVKAVGVEFLLDEIQIQGCYIRNTAFAGTTTTPLLRFSPVKCIFNENGNGDMNAQPEGNLYYFNKSGCYGAEYWTLDKILEYVVSFYTKTDSGLVPLDLGQLGLNLLPLVGRYIKFEFGGLRLEAKYQDFRDIVPMDFSLEGLGVYEALIKIAEESKKYMLYKAYTNSGKVVLRMKSKVATTASRETGDAPMLIRIGELGTAPNSTILFNGGNINLNRETKNIGRVVVQGDYLRINTLASSLAGSDTSLFSSDQDSYSAADMIDRTEILSVVSIAGNDFDNTQVMNILPLQMLNTVVSNLSADVTFYNGENSDIKIFDGIKLLEFDRSIKNATTDQQGNDIKDIGVYLPIPSLNGDGDTSIPTQDDGSYEYYYFVQAEKATSYFTTKHKGGQFSAVIVDGKNFEEGLFSDFLSNSEVHGYPAPFVMNGVTPIFIRANVRTDYRIKGIANLATYDSNIHQTLVVNDEDFKLTISHKDATFANGGFTEITDGYLQDSDQDILERIQAKADALLLKYNVVQNSGYISLDGFQHTMKVGDWTNKLTGTDRDINTPAVFAGISFDLQDKKTKIILGS